MAPMIEEVLRYGQDATMTSWPWELLVLVLGVCLVFSAGFLAGTAWRGRL